MFGFFAGFGLNTRFDFSPAPEESEIQEIFMGLGDMSFSQIYALFAAAITLISILGLIFFITSLISSPALIDAVNRLSRGGVYRFSECFSTGVDFFWRFLGLSVIGIVTVFAFVVIVILVGVLSFVVNTVIGVFSLMVLIPLFLAGAFVIYNILETAQRAIVVRNGSIFDSLEEGYILLKRNAGRYFVFFLINLAMLIGFSFAGAMLFMMVGIPVTMVLISGEAGLLTWILIGLFIGLPLSMVFGGWSATFFHSLYTIFYFELIEPTPSAPATAAPAIG